MSVYLHDIPLEQAKQSLQDALAAVNQWGILGMETIPVNEDAVGRILTEPVFALISSPHYHAAAMDGFAVDALSTEGALETNPVTISTGTGARYIDTGDPMPGFSNAVIPIEDVESLDADGNIASDPRAPKKIRIRASIPPWHHVRPMGEDMVATELILPSGHKLRPVDLGAIAGSGNTSIIVAREPRVGIIPTGTELVEIGEPIKPGDIIEYNSIVMASQIREWGGQPTRIAIIEDDYHKIKEIVRRNSENYDLLLINAGSSAGSEDFTARVVEELGTLFVHGVAVRPGHPVIIGMIENDDGKSTPVIGVPGYPVSAALTCEIFVKSLISRWLGINQSYVTNVNAYLTKKVTSPPGDDDYIRVAIGNVSGKTLAVPLSRGSGVITSLVRADGILIVPRGIQGLSAGEKVSVQLYREQSEIEKSIFAIGSHDITLDFLAQFLAPYNRRLVSGNVGSLGGLVALRRKEAHMAGAHLLDPDTGEYNLPYLSQYLPDEKVRVISLVGREQGLIIRKEDQPNIQTLEDLTCDGMRFINRQRGSGTRILLDYHLEKSSISPDLINGYDQVEFTHLMIASAVQSGRADCGLGIAAAAHALDLGFVPLFKERYDLIIPLDHAESKHLEPIYEVLNDENFKNAVSNLHGYDVSVMGNTIYSD